MKTTRLFLGLTVLITVMSLTVLGCGEETAPVTTPITLERNELPQLVSISLAIDLSKSGAIYCVPPFEPKRDLADFIAAFIEYGGGHIAVSHISTYNDVPPALLVIKPGKKPSAPVMPQLQNYDNEQVYYLARNVYEQEALPQYQAKLAEYERYCQKQIAAFWPEVERVLSTNIDSMWSDYHTALNRLHIAHTSAHPAITKHITIIYGDGIADTPNAVSLIDTTTQNVAFYWVHGTANPALAENQKWITTYKPIPVSSLDAVFHSIFQPLKNQ